MAKGVRLRDALRETFPFPPSAAFPGPPVKRREEAGSPGDPRSHAKPGRGSLTRLLNVRRDRAGDARPQDDV